MSNKAKYWWSVLYPENMIENWEDDISNLLQIPYAYCLHDKDIDSESDSRKDHIHLILAFSNTTTYKHATSVFSLLNKPGFKSFNLIKQVINIRFAYNYLIHDTDDCRKKNKLLYPASDRICGNNFDIGLFEQISVADKNIIIKEICDFISENRICNFIDFYDLFIDLYKDDSNYFDVFKSYSGLFERLIKGNFHKYIDSNK